MDATIGPGGAGMNLNAIKTCVRCGLRYDWRKSSTSTLKMTYCSTLCENGDLGFTLEALLKAERPPVRDADSLDIEREPTAPSI